jgi:hypothetical protein
MAAAPPSAKASAAKGASLKDIFIFNPLFSANASMYGAKIS